MRERPGGPQVFTPPYKASNHFFAVGAADRVPYKELPWEGRDMAPELAAERGYAPVPVRAGTLVALAGTLDHLSLPNRSPRPRAPGAACLPRRP